MLIIHYPQPTKFDIGLSCIREAGYLLQKGVTANSLIEKRLKMIDAILFCIKYPDCHTDNHKRLVDAAIEYYREFSKLVQAVQNNPYGLFLRVYCTHPITTVDDVPLQISWTSSVSLTGYVENFQALPVHDLMFELAMTMSVISIGYLNMATRHEYKEQAHKDAINCYVRASIFANIAKSLSNRCSTTAQSAVVELTNGAAAMVAISPMAYTN